MVFVRQLTIAHLRQFGLVVKGALGLNACMLKNIPLFIGLRYIRAKRRNQFISFVSGFSLLGMALGVMALILVLSVMNGFDNEMKTRLLRVIPHGFVDQKPGVENWQALRQTLLEYPDIKAAAPYISGFGLLGFGNEIAGVQLQGISPEYQREVSALSEHMLLGELESLQAGEFGVVLGALLARRLGVALGDRVTLTLPEVVITLAGVYPRLKRFTVVGIFQVDSPVDQDFAMIHIDDAARLWRRSHGPDGLQIKVDNIYQAGAILSQVKRDLGDDFQVKDWSQTQGSLFQTVKMEKLMIALLLGIIIAIAAFNIVSSLVLMVADKRSDIAVLRTLGLNVRQVMLIFMVQGFGVGVIGIFIGAVLGCILAVFIGPIVAYIESLVGLKMFDPSVYFISHLPSKLVWSDVRNICTVALALSFLATLYPAYRASKIEPAEALRYE